MSAMLTAVLLGACFTIGGIIGVGVLYVVAYAIVRVLAWAELKAAQREYRRQHGEG